MTLEFKLDQNVLNGVLDKFGIEAAIRPTEKETFILKAKAKISEGLKGWILSWGSKVKVLSPISLAEEVEVEIQKMLYHYSR